MKKRGEKVIKGRVQWRKEKEVHKLRIVLTVVAVFLCASVGAGAFLVWRQWDANRKAVQEAVAKVSAASAGSGEVSAQTEDDRDLLLVNSSRRVPEDYRPSLTGYGGVQVDSRILPALKKMMGDAASAGYPLKLRSGYVDEKSQETLYQAEVKRLTTEQKMSRVFAENKAQSTVGRGGYNENQTGLAVEFAAAGEKAGQSFAQTGQYRWLVSNCVNYGFILRYPDGKESVTEVEPNPAHFRYVGSAHAVQMRAYAMCLEEYAAYLSDRSDS